LFSAFTGTAQPAENDRIELTEITLRGNKTVTGSKLSIWGIYPGMDEATCRKILANSEATSSNETRTLPDGSTAINVIDDSRLTDFDLFSVVLVNGKVSEITLFDGLSDQLEGFNRELVNETEFDGDALVEGSFLGDADSVSTATYDEYSAKTERFYFKRGFRVTIHKDVRVDGGAFIPFYSTSFTFKNV
jgi:hypothetical protein